MIFRNMRLKVRGNIPLTCNYTRFVHVFRANKKTSSIKR
nr:MAG TPA: hypothetical protein [Caudoviricetes sp.]